ncbi:MAG: YkgJ family cysteine cluster protein [Saprospiraceae bacterium]|nr:YkgJ family cysteine cluster protein [Saprospiraceae bacterium]HMW39959.1 YkgJ family cysteine cluster protein [Saprospiraceae bacterium]HMX88663.1 YkgJ family cysteine cluster protein [Saprospiraceae bacterium]HMZ41284.1 YkgJ family cysteine cluster protein [Saprospiraceae bacterium]HNA65483.1 YkgJ family cysteine cluster protein [Saprospiraceae bacterium]
MDLNRHRELVRSRKKDFKEIFKRFRQMDDHRLDNLFHEAHEQAFSEIDCLQCANCCKTTSPRLYPRDIEEMAASLRIRPAEFMSKYVRIDEDGDYVFNQAPCPFLAEDNYCRIYLQRPKACREYPHTNRKKISQILDLTLENLKICPAVLNMVNRITSKN